MKVDFYNNSNLPDWLASLLAFLTVMACAAWFMVLPVMGLLYMLGWLK